MDIKFIYSVEIKKQLILVSQLPLTRSSRDVDFINTSPQAERTFFLKGKHAVEELPSHSTDIEADQRYSKRPKLLEKCVMQTSI